MCLCASMLVLEWKERVFIEDVFFYFRRPYPCTKTVHQHGVSIQSSTKVRETFRQIIQKLWPTKDLRLGQIVYALVFYNILFSLLLPLDGFQFNFFVAWQWKRSIKVQKLVPRFFANCSIHWGSNKNGVNPDRQGCCYPPAEYWFQAIMEILTERKSQWSNW